MCFCQPAIRPQKSNRATFPFIHNQFKMVAWTEAGYIDHANTIIQTVFTWGYLLQAVGRIYNAFKEQAGSTECRTLSGLDLTTPEGRKKLQETVKEQTCTRYVQVGSELLAKELEKV